MLHINPRMLPRLDVPEADLRTRKKRAIAEGCIGELEGIDLTLRFLHDKRAEAQRLLRLTSKIALPIPTLRTDT